ncbi:uncharacterized protein LOC119407288 [Rhipicephalus sanguineus]|uniref:uncharacterized protein LOC119407288 n=1 Tax=Rhipicephalus sanguineus TaxID=34632 RepID=UPI001893D155|nr:uncharacterized protein LOC119407288 [Rhipicephalus sanguineus]
MPNLRRVHRFRDHPTAGVNWRPTRFVDEVPSSYVCNFCLMVPKRILLLPCGHTLCKSCHAANSRGCHGRCPLDQEPFGEAECGSYDFPTRIANALKVCCWNEAHGCEFQGAIEDMLEHYENECTFHSVECLRCGEGVLHRELATHYAVGCSTGVSSTRTKNTSSESGALTLQDIRNALKEAKRLLRGSDHDQVLPSIQSHLNELTEQVRNLESRLAENTREVRSSVNAGTAQHTAIASSAVFQEPTSRQRPANEASTPTSTLSCSQQMLRNQKPEDLFDLSPLVRELMQKTSEQDYPQHAIEYVWSPPGQRCYLKLTTPLSTTRSWRQLLGTVTYVLVLSRPDFLRSDVRKPFCRITVLHTRDSYFTVEVRKNHIPVLRDTRVNVEIVFFGVVFGSCSAPSFNVSGYHGEEVKPFTFCPRVSPCSCADIGHSRVHFHATFHILHDEIEGVGRHSNWMQLRIQF